VSYIYNVKKAIILLTAISGLVGCSKPSEPVLPSAFGQPVKVTVTGYTGNAMEPFISRDGAFLFFNNLNAAPENTNLHYATRVSDVEFQYQGEIKGINTVDLEGTPTMDASGNLYFVSTRNYTSTLSTIYHANFSNGTASDVSLVNGVSKNIAGDVNFDVEATASGNFLYFVDSQFDSNNNPMTADLVIAQKSGSGFIRLGNSSDLLKNVNSNELEYAPGLSANELELFFTRVASPISSSSVPQIYMASRSKTDEAFGAPIKLTTLPGFVEGPSISGDGRTLYFHQKDPDYFQIYLVSRL
jgi:WD40-like Beta Propeller Repeat